MLRKLNATRTGSANAAAYHIVYKDGQYRVFDKGGKFRIGFATLPAAQSAPVSAMAHWQRGPGGSHRLT